MFFNFCNIFEHALLPSRHGLTSREFVGAWKSPGPWAFSIWIIHCCFLGTRADDAHVPLSLAHRKPRAQWDFSRRLQSSWKWERDRVSYLSDSRTRKITRVMFIFSFLGTQILKRPNIIANMTTRLNISKGKDWFKLKLTKKLLTHITK